MAKSDCKNILNLIPLYIDNMLSEEETDIVARHLETCEHCRNEYEFIATLTKETKKLNEIEVSSDFHKNLMAKAEQKARTKKSRKFILLRRAGAGVCAAAVIALCVVTYNGLNKHQESTNPDEYISPTSGVSQNPVKLTNEAPNTQSDVSAPKTQSTPIETPQKTVETPPEVAEAPSGGGSSAAPVEEACPSAISLDDTVSTYTVATVTTNEDNRDAIEQILSRYEKDETGYKVADINPLLLQLAEMGATVETRTDSTVTQNYIILE